MSNFVFGNFDVSDFGNVDVLNFVFGNVDVSISEAKTKADERFDRVGFRNEGHGP